MQYKVKEHWFWEKYKTEEPHTFEMFKKYMKPTYIDVGAWLGSTIFYAKDAGAKNIYGIEANPESFKHLIYNCEINNIKANLINKCIWHKSDEVIKFGHQTSSNSSVSGDSYDVITTTYLDYINGIKNHNTKFIKIDIEGFEEYIINDIAGTVYLSLHPPFWQDKKAMCENLKRFDNIVLAKTGKKIKNDKVIEMCQSEEQYPAWGTKQGNFFEVLIIC